MGWILLLLASGMEVLGVVGLKLYVTYKKISYSIIFIGGFTISYILLFFSLNYLSMSTAYAIWTGIGTSGAVLLNMIFFNEPKNKERIVSVLIIVISVVGLKLVS